MKLTPRRNKIWRDQTYTNSHYTKTIQTKHWLRPSIVAFIAAMFITGTAVAAKIDSQPSNTGNGTGSDNHEPQASEDSQLDTGNAQFVPEAEEVETNDESNSDDNSDSEASNNNAARGSSNSSSHTSIKIDASSRTTVNGHTTTSDPEVIINGQRVDLPNNGRVNEKYKDENGRTHIRARVDSDNTSVNVSTNESVETEGD